MIDTHAHIDTEAFDEDRDEVLERAFSNGVEYIIVPAIEPKTFEKLKYVVSCKEMLFQGIGIHPHNALEVNEETLAIIEKECSGNKKVVAVGEIGLDYYYDFAPKDVQKEAFRKQLKIAKKYNLPVIVHNRDSDDDLIDILKDEQDGSLKGVMHCFSGSDVMLRESINLGFHVSFTGNITFKKTNLSEIVKLAPIEKILLETDSPWMTPVPNRGKRNEPLNVRTVAEKIAEYKSISIEEVISMTTKSAKSLFRLLSLVILFVMMSACIASAFDDKDKSVPDETAKHPFEKFLGIGPYVGINTIVQTFNISADSTKPVTYEGIPLFGGTVFYGPFDFLLLQFSYLYSKNNKPTLTIDTSNGKQQSLVGPNIHQMLEFSTIWVINPYSKINFYLILGPSLIMNTINKGGGSHPDIYPEVSETQLGLNSGLGFMINLPIESVGLFTISAEWKLNFELTKATQKFQTGYHLENNKPIPEYKDVQTSQYFSMPRLTLVWYPEFFKFLK